MDDSNGSNSMWLQSSLHVPNDPITSILANGKMGSGNNGGDFAAPAPLSQSSSSNFNTSTNNNSRRGRLPSLALCSALNNNNNTVDFHGGYQQQNPDGRPSSARASVAGAHSQQLFALQEQLTLAKASQEDHKAEIGQLHDRLELEQKATKRWQDRAEQEAELRQAAEKKLQESKYSDSGDMAALREELTSVEQQLRDARRKAAQEKSDAVRQQAEQFEQERQQQEKWWKEAAAESAARIANLEQMAAQAGAWKRDMEVAQRNEMDLRGHVEALRGEVDNAQQHFEMQLRQELYAARDEHTRQLLKQEDEFNQRIGQIRLEEGQRCNALRARVNELEAMRNSYEMQRRDLEAANELARERGTELATAKRQAAAALAQLEGSHQNAMEQASAEHQQQIDALVREHSEETATLKSKIAAAAALNERCARIERLANEHQASAQKHEAELQAVLLQLGDMQRANIRLEQERDDWARRAALTEQAARQAEEEAARRVEAARAESHSQSQMLKEAIDRLQANQREVEEEYEANLETMLAEISNVRTGHAQAEAAWNKERIALRAAESDARRAAFESGDGVSAMQTTISTLTQRLEESNNLAQAARRERDAASNQLNELRAQLADMQRSTSKAEVELAGARSTVRALETRLEVVRAGSVAAGASMAMAASSSHSSMHGGGGSNFWSAPLPLTASGFSALPRFSKNTNTSSSVMTMMSNLKPGQVVEMCESNSNDDNASSNSNSNGNSSGNLSVPSSFSQPMQRTTAPAAGIRSALVSRSPSSQNISANANSNNNDDDNDANSGMAAKIAALGLPLPQTAGAAANNNGKKQQQRRNRTDEADLAATKVVHDNLPRVFAFTGFDAAEVQRLSREIEQLGGRVVECKANSIPPHDCTHLVSNGLITVKLLTALARGMWVVPSSFVLQCVASQGFVDEKANGGIRHENGPYFGSSAVAFTPAFLASRHAQTAQTVASEGGATVVDTAAANVGDMSTLLESAATWPKLNRTLKQRVLVCTAQELNEVQGELTGKRFAVDVVTWDMVLKRLYPENLCA